MRDQFFLTFILYRQVCWIVRIELDEDAGSFLGECSGDSSLSSGFFFFFPVFCFLDGLPVVSSCSSVGSSRSASWSSASGFVRIAGGEGTTTVGRIG